MTRVESNHLVLNYPVFDLMFTETLHLMLAQNFNFLFTDILHLMLPDILHLVFTDILHLMFTNILHLIYSKTLLFMSIIVDVCTGRFLYNHIMTLQDLFSKTRTFHVFLFIKIKRNTYCFRTKTDCYSFSATWFIRRIVMQ